MTIKLSGIFEENFPIIFEEYKMARRFHENVNYGGRNRKVFLCQQELKRNQKKQQSGSRKRARDSESEVDHTDHRNDLHDINLEQSAELRTIEEEEQLLTDNPVKDFDHTMPFGDETDENEGVTSSCSSQEEDQTLLANQIEAENSAVDCSDDSQQEEEQKETEVFAEVNKDDRIGHDAHLDCNSNEPCQYGLESEDNDDNLRQISELLEDLNRNNDSNDKNEQNCVVAPDPNSSEIEEEISEYEENNKGGIDNDEESAISSASETEEADEPANLEKASNEVPVINESKTVESVEYVRKPERQNKDLPKETTKSVCRPQPDSSNEDESSPESASENDLEPESNSYSFRNRSAASNLKELSSSSESDYSYTDTNLRIPRQTISKTSGSSRSSNVPRPALKPHVPRPALKPHVPRPALKPRVVPPPLQPPASPVKKKRVVKNRAKRVTATRSEASSLQSQRSSARIATSRSLNVNRAMYYYESDDDFFDYDS